MSEFENIPPELTGFESSLARLNPAASRIDRDRLMFRLGQNSRGGGRLRLLWPSAAIALAIVSSALGLRLATSQRPRVVYVELKQPVAAAAAETVPQTDRTDQMQRPESMPGEPWTAPGLTRLDAAVMAAPVLRVRDMVATMERSTADGWKSPAQGEAASPAAAPPLRLGDRQLWHEWLEQGKDST